MQVCVFYMILKNIAIIYIYIYVYYLNVISILEQRFDVHENILYSILYVKKQYYISTSPANRFRILYAKVRISTTPAAARPNCPCTMLRPKDPLPGNSLCFRAPRVGWCRSCSSTACPRQCSRCCRSQRTARVRSGSRPPTSRRR